MRDTMLFDQPHLLQDEDLPSSAFEWLPGTDEPFACNFPPMHSATPSAANLEIIEVEHEVCQTAESASSSNIDADVHVARSRMGAKRAQSKYQHRGAAASIRKN